MKRKSDAGTPALTAVDEGNKSPRSGKTICFCSDRLCRHFGKPMIPASCTTMNHYYAKYGI
jgi:hypothetical protein